MSEFLELFELQDENNNNQLLSSLPKDLKDDIQSQSLSQGPLKDNHSIISDNNNIFIIPLKLPPGFTQKDVDLRKFYYKYECFSEVQLKDCIEKLNINLSQTTDLLQTDSTDSTNSTYESIDLGRAYSSSSLSDIENTTESTKDKVKIEMISESPLPSTPKTYDFTSFPRSSPTPPPTPPLSNYVPRSDYILKNKFKNINIPTLLDSPSCNLSRKPNNYYYNNNNNEDFIPSKRKLFRSTLSDNIDNIPSSSSSNFKDLNSDKSQQQTQFDNNKNGLNIHSETFQSFILGNDINQNTINKAKNLIALNPLPQENLVAPTDLHERSDVSVVIETAPISQVTMNKISPAKDNEIKSSRIRTTRSSSVPSTSTTSTTKSHVKETLTTKSPITRSSSSATKASSSSTKASFETSGHALKRTRIKWTVVELEALEEGMKTYGTSWTAIHEEFGREGGPLCNRDPTQLKDKARTEKKHRIKHGIPLGIFKKATGGY
ncbi:1020_t:CDS:2 [Diversispora eburnea]|uniref:1020_t:CDS:1 n=1 Tax=Diversispora eburnea TaxID=1213867 RepID=A0A9N9FLJ0_9GLOM|nr:1020_t:CDS:2 [Diversispora eburnea]